MRSRKNDLVYCAGRGDAGDASLNQQMSSIFTRLQASYRVTDILDSPQLLPTDCAALSYVAGNPPSAASAGNNGGDVAFPFML
jgi:hypothetical protein